MNRVAVQSSNLAEIGYNPQSQTLEIMFRNGAVYQYFDVPEHVFKELLDAASPGRYFHSAIKGSYRYARL